MTFEERLDRIAERHESLSQAVELLAIEHAKTEATIRLGVREDRKERVKSQLLAKPMEGLAVMQRVTEEKLQRFLDSRLGGNGHTS